MRTLAFAAILSITALPLAAAFAQAGAPELTLRISPSQSVISVSKVSQTVFSLGEYTTRFAIEVEETNISGHTLSGVGSGNTESWYELKVLWDGEPAPPTKSYYAHLHPNPKPNTESGAHVLTFGSGGYIPIEPGKTEKLRVPITDYFDMGKPGQYEITFSKGPQQGEPIEVESNTVMVTVVPDKDMPTESK
jgi:hypothetical protein